jgi:hypothetical protein
MPNTAASHRIEASLQRFVDHHAAPQPGVETTIDISVDGGLALIATRQVFCNTEPRSIEICMTFPVPVQAVVFALAAELDGKLYRARALPRVAARAAYEAAVDAGHAAVLHEELLRGIHLLSVAHVPANGRVAVTLRYALPLAGAEPGRLRLPMTVGQVYGASPLSESVDLRGGGPQRSAAISLRCGAGRARLIGCEGGAAGDQALSATVGLHAPIDIEVQGWLIQGCAQAPLRGVAADGAVVTLSITPDAAPEAPLDAVVLVDRSGSMAAAAVHGDPRSMHQMAVDGLRRMAATLGADDRCALWEFSHQATRVGADLATALHRLGPPSGGTEIGLALATVLDGEAGRDVIVLTDGKSHALDVQALAASGRRIHAVLIGEDSLEAHIGTLAALTGGALLAADPADLHSSLGTVFAAARRTKLPAPMIAEPPVHVTTSVNGLLLDARWSAPIGDEAAGDEAAGDAEPDGTGRAVAALATALVLPRMTAEAATALAVREGLVCHLTSLVLVQTDGETQTGLPARRRIALSDPRVARACVPLQAFAPPPMDGQIASAAPPAGFAAAGPAMARSAHAEPASLRSVAAGIDWDRDPGALAKGSLGGLDPIIVEAILRTAADRRVKALAALLGVAAVTLVIGLLAFRATAEPSAQRIARTVLRGCDTATIADLCVELGLIDAGPAPTDRSRLP